MKHSYLFFLSVLILVGCHESVTCRKNTILCRGDDCTRLYPLSPPQDDFISDDEYSEREFDIIRDTLDIPITRQIDIPEPDIPQPEVPLPDVPLPEGEGFLPGQG